MKLPISKLNYPSQPLSDNTYFVVDKEISPNAWKSYKVKLSSVKEYIETTSPVEGIITELHPTPLDMASTTKTITGYKGTDANSTSPASGWMYGSAFVNSSNHVDAQYAAWGAVLTRFDSTSALISTKSITYNNTMGGISGSPSGTTTASVESGLGGQCINSITFGSNERKLITQVDICPYISGCITGNSYWNSSYYPGLVGNGWYWGDTSNMCFGQWQPGTYRGVYSRGKYYRVEMTLQKPDNTTTTIPMDVTDEQTKEASGWTTYSSSIHKNHYITFDFSQDILDARLPEGTYTTKLVFKEATSSSGCDSAVTMAMHGARFFYNA